MDRIVDCRGPRRDPAAHATPLVAGLLARGAARVDALGIGLDVGPGCGLLRRDGTESARVFAMGPASRAAFWEITAIPDILLISRWRRCSTAPTPSSRAASSPSC